MEYAIFALKLPFLLYAVIFGAGYVVRAAWCRDISDGVGWRMGIGVTGFVALQWLLPT